MSFQKPIGGKRTSRKGGDLEREKIRRSYCGFSQGAGVERITRFEDSDREPAYWGTKKMGSR